MTNVWALWLAGLLVTFAAIEGTALVSGRPTLSLTVWRAQARYPILAFLTGAVVGGLAIHFFGWVPACNP